MCDHKKRDTIFNTMRRKFVATFNIRHLIPRKKIKRIGDDLVCNCTSLLCVHLVICFDSWPQIASRSGNKFWPPTHHHLFVKKITRATRTHTRVQSSWCNKLRIDCLQFRQIALAEFVVVSTSSTCGC